MIQLYFCNAMELTTINFYLLIILSIIGQWCHWYSWGGPAFVNLKRLAVYDGGASTVNNWTCIGDEASRFGVCK